MCMPIYCLAVALPLRLILYVAQELIFFLMMMVLLFACALLFLAALVLLHFGVRNAVHGIHIRAAKLIGGSVHPISSKEPILHLPTRR
jgi:hypothetical protein